MSVANVAGLGPVNRLFHSVAMKDRVLIAAATALILDGCTTGGPNDVALIGGKSIVDAEV